jgi:2,3-bisphosphoglycerate-dependent phosphoglycerate mutase
MYELVLLRHGESTWNRDNRFTGWTDVDITELGAVQARHAAVKLKEAGYAFDLVYTSVLKRCIRTAWLVLDEMDLMWIPVVADWRMNERHYGALTGLDKAETAARYGDQQTLAWRRSYDVAPPPLAPDDPRALQNDPRYAGIAKEDMPLTESLKDTVTRALPSWSNSIAPAIKAGKRIIIIAHGNSLRALIKHLDGISDDDIPNLNIANGVPIIYRLDADLRPISHYFLD